MHKLKSLKCTHSFTIHICTTIILSRVTVTGSSTFNSYWKLFNLIIYYSAGYFSRISTKFGIFRQKSLGIYIMWLWGKCKTRNVKSVNNNLPNLKVSVWNKLSSTLHNKHYFPICVKNKISGQDEDFLMNVLFIMWRGN